STRSDGVAVDLTLQADGRPYRLEIRCGAQTLRGGVAGAALLWSSPFGEHETSDAGFFAASPAFLVATARMLAGRAPITVSLAEVALPSLAVLTIRQRWSPAGREEHPTDLGPLAVQAWNVDDPDTGVRRIVHLAGDVVVAADGIALIDLDGPPHQS
ncbi:MAG TPA: hypothetical protein VGN54_06130, partial [Mycobacteriales bacterium]|nr:hypothetical protein [Mycobacteriales bacterium]